MSANKMYDVVVVGAGSNSLSAAAYMAKVGKKVLVLEKNKYVGGGAVSVEVAPGFIHDPHAAGLIPCAVNPAISKDELGLCTKFGLKFLEWGACFTTLFDDGSVLATSRSVDQTAQSIAKFSAKDAESYRAFANKCVQIAPLLSIGAATPPMPFPGFLSLLESSDLGSDLAQGFFNSAYEVLCQNFESLEVRLHYMKWIGEAMENPEAYGTGILVYSLMAMVHSSGSYLAVGGTQKLSDSLAHCIEHYGGDIRTESEVVKVIVSDGRAAGVELKGGERIMARDAVVACIHPWRLKDFVPEVDDRIASDARKVRLSNHGAVNQQISLSRIPKFISDDPILHDSMCVEFMPRGDFLGMRKIYDGYRYGEIPYGHFNPLVIMNSLKDPSRVPSPDQLALYLYHFAPMELAEGGLQAWDSRKQEYGDLVWDSFKKYTTNIDDSCILGRLIETPLDHHRHSGNMMNGDIFGIGTAGGQIMGRRPTPALSGYRVPSVKGLYLSGPFMHPGGTVTLGGRATAIAMFQDMDLDLNSAFEI
ncbi:MAG: NAD(P)/FAD-dependent oxidoreductase [Caulobacterales bacterium]